MLIALDERQQLIFIELVHQLAQSLDEGSILFVQLLDLQGVPRVSLLRATFFCCQLAPGRQLSHQRD
jgi:hypothetical protein